MTKKTTADLIVLHSERHLETETLKSDLKAEVREFFGPALFILGGVLVVLFAFQFLSYSIHAEEKVFLIQNDGTVAAEKVFYDAEKIAVTSPAQSEAPTHAAANPARASEAAGVLGLLAIISMLWYLNHRHGLLENDSPHFTVRRIR